MPKLPSPSDWEAEDKQELLNAGIKGWNPLMRLPVLLRRNFEWAKPFDFGFFSGSDVDEARSYGWEHVRTEYFDIDDYNKHVATPFGIYDAGGVVKWRDNFLMMMPKSFRKAQLDRRFDAYEKSVGDSLNAAAYAHPEDPRFSDMKQAAKELSQGETYRVQISPESEDKPKRGRPPKNKE